MNPRAIPRRPRIIPISLVRTTLARMTLASAVAVRLLCIGAPARAEQVKETHPLLGASLEITVDSPDLETGQNRIRDAISVATVLESELMPGNEGNDVGKLNASAGLGVRTVPLDLYRLLALSQVMTRSTGDAFDVTIGPLLRRRQPARPETATPGEQHTAADGSFGQPPAASGSFSQPPAAGGSFSMDEALSLVGADKIVLHPPNRVELPSAGMSVDFSAIVRGYVLERMAVALRAGGTTSALLAFADTTMLVIGPPAGEPPVRVWVPRGRSMAGSVALRDMSMSTARAHRRSDDPRPPIVDPRSGRFVESDRQATVVARNAAIAEAWSTALVVDPDGALVLLDEPRDVEAVVFDEHGEHASPRFVTYVDWKPARQPGDTHAEPKLTELRR